MQIKSHRNVLWIAVLATVIGMSMGVANANHSWGGYHWARTVNPFVLKLGNNLSATWSTYLGVTSSNWSTSAVLDTNIVAGGTNSKNCRATLGRVEVCNATYGNNGWLGIASVWATGTHITQGTVKMNDSYFKTAAYNTPAWKKFVMCQEVGHTLGLDHQDEVFSNTNLGTCMDYTNDPDGTLLNQLGNLQPNQHDYDMLEGVYAHLDQTTTVRQAAASTKNGEIDHNNKQTWGHEIRRSVNRRTSVYEREDGNDHKVFTFVTWAEPQENHQD